MEIMNETLFMLERKCNNNRHDSWRTA